MAAPPAGSRGETRVKMSRIRMRTAERLKSSQNTAAMLTTFNEVDMRSVSVRLNCCGCVDTVTLFTLRL